MIYGILAGIAVFVLATAAIPEGAPAWVALAAFVGDKIYLWTKHWRGTAAPNKIDQLKNQVEQNNAAIQTNKTAIDEHTKAEMEVISEIRDNVSDLNTSVSVMSAKVDDLRDAFVIVPKGSKQ